MPLFTTTYTNAMEVRLQDMEKRILQLERDTELGYNPQYPVWHSPNYDGYRYHASLKSVVDKLLAHVGLELTHIPETQSRVELKEANATSKGTGVCSHKRPDGTGTEYTNKER